MSLSGSSSKRVVDFRSGWALCSCRFAFATENICSCRFAFATENICSCRFAFVQSKICSCRFAFAQSKASWGLPMSSFTRVPLLLIPKESPSPHSNQLICIVDVLKNSSTAFGDDPFLPVK